MGDVVDLDRARAFERAKQDPAWHWWYLRMQAAVDYFGGDSERAKGVMATAAEDEPSWPGNDARWARLRAIEQRITAEIGEDCLREPPPHLIDDTLIEEDPRWRWWNGRMRAVMAFCEDSKQGGQLWSLAGEDVGTSEAHPKPWETLERFEEIVAAIVQRCSQILTLPTPDIRDT